MVDQQKVGKIINKLSNSKARDLHGLDTHLINLSFRTGKFPQSLKVATIMPIFKAGSLDQVGNYRPISRLASPDLFANAY